MHVFRRWSEEQSGSVGAWFALAALPVAVMTGAGVDYARATMGRAALQAETDQAALKAAAARVTSDADRAALAQAFFPPPPSTTGSVTPTPTSSAAVSGDLVTVTARRSLSTAMMGLVGLNTVTVSARSIAKRTYQGPPICMMALNATASGAITIMGSATLVAAGCAVYSNSSSGSAIVAGGSASATAGGFCAVGGVSATGSTLKPTAETGCARLPDPFASLPSPTSSGTTYNNVSVQPTETQTLSPGTYKSGLTLKGTATLNPGLYIINGQLNISSQANVSGSGVTFYLTGSQASFTINGGGTINLTPMTTGAYAGMLIVQDRTANVGNDNKLNGDSNTKLVGDIYTPTQTLTLTGSSGFGQSSTSMPIIVDQLKLSGNTTVHVDVNAPQAIPLPLSRGGARLTQ